MDKEIIENLEKNDYLKEKLSVIENLIEKEDYREAYYKLAAMLEYINIKYIKTKYNMDMPDSSVINILETYIDRDKFLENNMQVINAEYNDVNMSDVKIEDLEYLAGTIDFMYKYMVDKVGEFIKK